MLPSFYVIPGHTAFYYGFNVPQKMAAEYATFFDLGKGSLTKDIKIILGNKTFPAKLRVARIVSPKYPNRHVVQICYPSEFDFLKAFRKTFIYSYASTINKEKPQLKELFEVEWVKDKTFKFKIVAQQKTDFDGMFQSMEDKNLFEYWKKRTSGKGDNFFIDFSRKWISVNDLDIYAARANVIYILYNSRTHQLYVGKANILGNRVKKGKGRVGMENDWDRFMFFEIDPNYNLFIEQIEAFVIRSYAALLLNTVGAEPLNDKNIRLVNRSLRNN